MFGDDAPKAATALASVQARRTPQSTNPNAVQAALDDCRRWSASVQVPVSNSQMKPMGPRSPEGAGNWKFGVDLGSCFLGICVFGVTLIRTFTQISPTPP